MRVPYDMRASTRRVLVAWYIAFSKCVDRTRFNNGLVCDLKKDLDSNSFLGWHL